jgi:hypothetical protein
MDKNKLKERMIGFHKWMLTMDTEANAEQFFHYTDEDMAEMYLDEWGPGWRDISKPLEREPQDTVPAICEYSGLRPVEGYQEEIDKEIKKAIIANLDTEEGKELVEVFRRGWLAGYDKGLYDKEMK